MDMMKELYDAHAHSLEAEEALSASNKELMDIIESNISQDKRESFLDTVESVIRNREQYFFHAGFHAAKDLLLK